MKSRFVEKVNAEVKNASSLLKMYAYVKDKNIEACEMLDKLIEEEFRNDLYVSILKMLFDRFADDQVRRFQNVVIAVAIEDKWTKVVSKVYEEKIANPVLPLSISDNDQIIYESLKDAIEHVFAHEEASDEKHIVNYLIVSLIYHSNVSSHRTIKEIINKRPVVWSKSGSYWLDVVVRDSNNFSCIRVFLDLKTVLIYDRFYVLNLNLGVSKITQYVFDFFVVHDSSSFKLLGSKKINSVLSKLCLVSKSAFFNSAMADKDRLKYSAVMPEAWINLINAKYPREFLYKSGKYLQSYHVFEKKLLEPTDKRFQNSRKLIMSHDQFSSLIRAIRLRYHDNYLIAQHLVCVSYLAFYAGARLTEILGLRYCDIVSSPDDGIVIYINPYNEKDYKGVVIREHSLKSNNATRRLHIKHLFPSDVYRCFSEFIDFSLARHPTPSTLNKNNNGLLFHWGEEHYNSNNWYIDNLQDLIRFEVGHVSGDIHMLRHSFASWYFLKYFLLFKTTVAHHDINFSIFFDMPMTVNYLKDTDDFNWLYGKRINHLFIYHISRLLGHGSSDVAIENYIHLIELAEHMLVSCDVDIRFVECWSGISKSTLYARRKESLQSMYQVINDKLHAMSEIVEPKASLRFSDVSKSLKFFGFDLGLHASFARHYGLDEDKYISIVKNAIFLSTLKKKQYPAIDSPWLVDKDHRFKLFGFKLDFFDKYEMLFVDKLKTDFRIIDDVLVFLRLYANSLRQIQVSIASCADIKALLRVYKYFDVLNEDLLIKTSKENLGKAAKMSVFSGASFSPRQPYNKKSKASHEYLIISAEAIVSAAYNIEEAEKKINISQLIYHFLLIMLISTPLYMRDVEIKSLDLMRRIEKAVT